MFNSLNDFKTDPKTMRIKQNSTVRNVAGFRKTGNHTLFSNSYLKDSVISTLKHNSQDGEKFSEHENSSDENENLTNPRLSTDDLQNSIANNAPPTLYNKTLYPVRQGNRDHGFRTSYFNQMIIEKDAHTSGSKQSYYKERYRK